MSDKKWVKCKECTIEIYLKDIEIQEDFPNKSLRKVKWTCECGTEQTTTVFED